MRPSRALPAAALRAPPPALPAEGIVAFGEHGRNAATVRL